jgi:hypothetical protein
VGAGGRRVDRVPPAGARGELAQAAIRMRSGMSSLCVHAARQRPPTCPSLSLLVHDLFEFDGIQLSAAFSFSGALA